MAARNTYPIDWRRELKKLAPYLNGRGGVVRITFNGDDCAPREFREIITGKFEYKPDNKNWKSIRIAREWHSTRGVPDILHEFEIKLSNDAGAAKDKKEAKEALHILAENEFYGSAEINIDNLNINVAGPHYDPRARDQRVREICERINQFLAQDGRMMVVLNPAPPADQAEFWYQLWNKGLGGLVSKGLLFVQMVDRSTGKPIFHDCTPEPELTVDLPTNLDDDRADEAFDDLMDILAKELPGLTREVISAVVTTHLANNEDSIKKLHDNLPKLIVKLGQEHRHGA